MSKTPVKKPSFKPYPLSDVNKGSNRKLFSVVSTFAGGGGSSTGYKRAGGKVYFANEFIPTAAETYRANYPDTPVLEDDIRKLLSSEKNTLNVFKSYGIKKGEYDILDGSPPCASFSVAGKGKSKIHARKVKYSDTVQDRIGLLIFHYVKLAAWTKPKVCVIENVPPIKKSRIFKDAIERLTKYGYLVNFKVLCASHFGVPQRRKRLLVVAVRSDIAKKVGLKDEDDILGIYPEGTDVEPTLEEAFEGLEINQQERNLLLTSMRKSSSYEIISSIPKNPPKNMRVSDIVDDWTSDFSLTRCSWKCSSPTLTQMGQQIGHGGICHPSEDRIFTIGELKRLQGLPDDFILTGTFNQKAERICRMVPPLLTYHLSKSIYENVLK